MNSSQCEYIKDIPFISHESVSVFLLRLTENLVEPVVYKIREQARQVGYSDGLAGEQ